MKTTTNPRMWGHRAGCHRNCCGWCSCGYECSEFTDAEKAEVLRSLPPSFLRLLEKKP